VVVAVVVVRVRVVIVGLGVGLRRVLGLAIAGEVLLVAVRAVRRCSGHEAAGHKGQQDGRLHCSVGGFGMYRKQSKTQTGTKLGGRERFRNIEFFSKHKNGNYPSASDEIIKFRPFSEPMAPHIL
jgi:hypothetical protein